MNVSSPSATAVLGRVPPAFHAPRPPSVGPQALDRTVWEIELRRASPVSRIAIERVAATDEYRVLVDEVEVGRSDRLDLVLGYVQRFKAVPGRAGGGQERSQ